MQPYPQRLTIPPGGKARHPLHTRAGEPFATGYSRVVIGERGPYVEFSPSQVTAQLTYVDTPHYYFAEARTAEGVMVYHQKHRVEYADYLPGMLYVSPFYLFDAKGVRIIDPPDPRQLTLFGEGK